MFERVFSSSVRGSVIDDRKSTSRDINDNDDLDHYTRAHANIHEVYIIYLCMLASENLSLYSDRARCSNRSIDDHNVDGQLFRDVCHCIVDCWSL